MLPLLAGGCAAVEDWFKEQTAPAQQTQAPSAPKQTAALPPPTSLQPALPRPVRKPAPPGSTGPGTGAPTSAAPPGGAGSRDATTSPPSSLPPEAADPERLIGMSQGEAASLLGEPTQRAEAAPATVWRYAGPQCELDLYFYLDLQSQVLRVLHYEVKGDEPTDTRRGRCFEQFVAEQRDRDRAGGGGGEAGAYRSR
jgi:hypothetical protein